METSPAPEPNPWLNAPVVTAPVVTAPASAATAVISPQMAPAVQAPPPPPSAEATKVAPTANVDSEAVTDKTADLRRREKARARRLAVANVAAIISAAIAVATLFSSWWTFTIGDSTLSIAQVGGGFTTVPIKGAHASLSGLDAGGATVVGAMVLAVLIAAVASYKRWWWLAVVPLIILTPMGPGVPPSAPPASVASPQSLGAQLTEASSGLRALRLVWWVVLMLLIVIAVQCFVVWRAHKAVDKAENPESQSLLGRGLDRFVTASLSRIGVEVMAQVEQAKATKK